MPTEVLSPRVEKLVQSARALLERAVREHGSVVYSNSLGAEAMVLTDLICTYAPQIDMVTLDTGRLHDETLALLDRIERRYNRRIQVFYPDAQALEAYVRENGVNGFYLGQQERRSCCDIRKIEPFKRAILGYKAWVTGVRREQSAERALGESLAWDPQYELYKVSPLLDWTESDIWAYIRAKNLPYNVLHDQGFPSIGCAPCTRPVEPGADPRSGRWWWEAPEARECGLHPRRRVIPLKVEPLRAVVNN
jgi:phosphoadenosine phosphosulfate reductase